MPLPPRLFAGDEELGKRDDDHKPGAKSPLGIAWQHRRIPHGPLRRNMKRIAWGAVALVLLYYFFKNMPTDLERRPSQRPNFDQPGLGAAPRPPAAPQGSMQQPGLEDSALTSLRNFNGPIKFYQLASTLHAVSQTKGADLVNRNVVCITSYHTILHPDHSLAIRRCEPQECVRAFTHCLRNGYSRKEFCAFCTYGAGRYIYGHTESC